MSAHPSAEQLSAFLDQELPDAGRLSIEEHLRECDACAAHLAELAAEDLRIAARSLGQLLGRVDVEDLLDVIFRDFCIGK